MDADESKAAAPAVSGPVRPHKANLLTRIIYCVALLSLPLATLGQSSWVAMVTGGGLLAWGQGLFFLVSAAFLYRFYLVVRYPHALDARPPNALGWLLRALGWLVMLASVLATTSLFLIKPITLLLFKTAGENGIAFFVVGVYAAMFAGVGWIGCALFEISRVAGKRVTEKHAPMTKSKRRQDWTVLATLSALAFALPHASRWFNGEPCYGPTFTRCAAKVEGGVRQLAMLAHGAPVVLQTNLDEVQYSKTGTPKWAFKENLLVSLRKAGHPVDNTAASPVSVDVQAVKEREGVNVTLRVMENGTETARFITRYARGARLEAKPGGGQSLVVELGRNVDVNLPPAFYENGKHEFGPDELYHQVRQAIGSQREVEEANRIVRGQAVLLSSNTHKGPLKLEEGRPAANCLGKATFKAGDAETGLRRDAGNPLPIVVFAAAPPPGTTALVRANDTLNCRDDSVWMVGVGFPEREMHIRRYDMNGVLMRYVAVALPPLKDEHDFVDHGSVVEKDGGIEFQTLVSGLTSRRTERYRIKF